MTGQIRNQRQERELDSYVESPTRANKTAQEVIVTNALSISTSGLATEVKQDTQITLQTSANASLTSIDGKVATAAKQDSQTTILSNILSAISGVLNIRALAFLTDKVDASGSSVSVSNFPATQNVNVTSSVLPSGASTSAKQDLLLAELQQKADLTDTQPVSVSSLPLPSGASTSALQTSGNSILSNILSAIQGVLNIRSLVFANDKVDVSGSTVTANIGILVRKNTYAAAAVSFSYAANGTDIFTISGVAGKRIRIKHISLNGTQQNISSRDVLILKRSSLNTGGTFTPITPTPFNSSFPASNVVARYYTDNPTTLGDLVGIVQAEKVIIGAASGVNVSGDDLKINFGNEDESELVLNGVNEIMAINMNGVTSSQNLINVDCKWIEENI